MKERELNRREIWHLSRLQTEVRVKEVVESDTAEVTEQIRREELDIDTQGRPVVER